MPPIKGTAQVKFEALDGTEPILSMPMLVAKGDKVVFRGEDAVLITVAGETAPLTSVEDVWHLKVLINNSNEFISIDVWTPCPVCPPSWVRNLSLKMKQHEQHVVRETTRSGMWDFEIVTKPEDNSNWCRGQNPQRAGAGRRCGVDANGDEPDQRGISFLAIRRAGHFVTVSR